MSEAYRIAAFDVMKQRTEAQPQIRVACPEYARAG
jgi:hypothetical protein